MVDTYRRIAGTYGTDGTYGTYGTYGTDGTYMAHMVHTVYGTAGMYGTVCTDGTYGTYGTDGTRDQLILLFFLPIFLSSNSFFSYLLCSIFCSRIRIVLTLLCINFHG